MFKKITSSLIVCTLLTLLPIQSSKALDYTIEGLAECNATNSQSNECKAKYCEQRNIENNWPKNTNYQEDCSKYDEQNIEYITAGLLSLAAVIGAIFILRKAVIYRKII